MSNTPTHDVLLAENYTTQNGEERSHFTNIGSAWQKDSGTMSVQIRDGLSVNGRFVIMPKKDKDDSED